VNDPDPSLEIALVIVLRGDAAAGIVNRDVVAYNRRPAANDDTAFVAGALDIVSFDNRRRIASIRSLSHDWRTFGIDDRDVTSYTPGIELDLDAIVCPLHP